MSEEKEDAIVDVEGLSHEELFPDPPDNQLADAMLAARVEGAKELLDAQKEKEELAEGAEEEDEAEQTEDETEEVAESEGETTEESGEEVIPVIDREVDFGDGPVKISELEITQKVLGEEKTTTIGEVLRQAQKAEAADKRLRELSSSAKNQLAVIERTENEPYNVQYQLLISKGLSEQAALEKVLQSAQKIVADRFEYEQLSEHEKKIHDLERQIEQEKLRSQRAREDSERAVLTDKQKKIVNELLSAAEEVGLNKDERIINGIARVWDEARDIHGEELTMVEAAKRFKVDEFKRLEAYAESLSEDEIKQLPKKLREKVQRNGAKERVSRVKQSKRDSTSKAKSQKRHKDDPGVYKNFDEARYWAMMSERDKAEA
jgi:hypothetical protein